MKKLLVVLLAVLVAFSCCLVGCNKNDGTSKEENDAKKEQDTEIEISIVFVEGVVFNKQSIGLIVGSEINLYYTVTPVEATDKSVEFSSSDISVVTVDANGKIKGIKKGSATITVKTVDGNFTSTCLVTVKEKSNTELPDVGS